MLDFLTKTCWLSRCFLLVHTLALYQFSKLFPLSMKPRAVLYDSNFVFWKHWPSTCIINKNTIMDIAWHYHIKYYLWLYVPDWAMYTTAFTVNHLRRIQNPFEKYTYSCNGMGEIMTTRPGFESEPLESLVRYSTNCAIWHCYSKWSDHHIAIRNDPSKIHWQTN